jgi:hypothetical protein
LRRSAAPRMSSGPIWSPPPYGSELTMPTRCTAADGTAQLTSPCKSDVWVDSNTVERLVICRRAHHGNRA